MSAGVAPAAEMTLVEAYAVCRAIAKREAKNFYYAFRVLPAAKRDAMCAVYAFMRRADDIADDETLSVEARRAMMAEWLGEWRAARSGGDSQDAMFLALGDTQRRFGIPDGLLEELVQGTAMDLEESGAGAGVAVGAGLQGYRTFEELYRYCYLVASVVGLVCIRIFGYTDPRAEALAERTGIAFQLTNILRDVKEDAERGRLYLPMDLMGQAGVGPEDVKELAEGRALRDGERALLRTMSAKAWGYYEAAEELLPLIDADSRAALWVLVRIYSGLLKRIDVRDGDVFSERVSVPTGAKLAILAQGATKSMVSRVMGVIGERDVLVVGAGLAGLSAAVALAGDGAKVRLLERRPEVGGRVYSYPHPALEETVDSQHVVLGCCTNLLGLLAESGGAELIRWYDELLFLEPGGAGREARRSVMRPGVLPAPSHQTVSFLRAPILSLRDKAGIAAGLMEFLRGYPADDAESFATWLQRTKQTERAVRHFWEPVVVGALNDGFANCSTKYAGKVFHESFLRSAEGGRLGIPAVPLSEMLAPIAERARELGVVIERKAGVERLEVGDDGRWRVWANGEETQAGAVVLAMNFREAAGLLQGLPGGEAMDFGQFISAPITTIQLWYDRDVTGVDHAVLLDTRIQWVFAKSRIRKWAAERGSYLELVISASWPELKMGREEILAAALRELELFFPSVRQAKLLKSGVLKEARATFSVTPGLDRFRPQQQTAWPGLYLAGDWTATEWPSTMEGAVRSGRMAAGAVAGDCSRYLAAETPATGLMRWLI